MPTKKLQQASGNDLHELKHLMGKVFETYRK